MEEDASARWVFEVGEEDHLVAIGRTKQSKPCHWFVWLTGVVAQEAAAQWKNVFRQAEIIDN